MALITEAPETINGTIIGLFRTKNPISDGVADNIVVQFDIDGVKAVYNNESYEIPEAITQKPYGVYLNNRGDMSCEFMGVKYMGGVELESVHLGQQITFHRGI